MHVSRPTVDAWIQRFETEPFAGLVDKSRAPKSPARKVWLPLMIPVSHVQQRHPVVSLDSVDEGATKNRWSLADRADRESQEAPDSSTTPP